LTATTPYTCNIYDIGEQKIELEMRLHILKRVPEKAKNKRWAPFMGAQDWYEYF